MSELKWKRLSEEKPGCDMVCWVCNERWGGGLEATYLKNFDVFSWYRPNIHESIALDVTHWFELPDPMVESEGRWTEGKGIDEG